MRSTFLGFEVSKRTIQIAQKSIDITNNNLSNANTAGYTRQRVDLNSTYLYKSSRFTSPVAMLSMAGQGVNAFGVSQLRDPYIDKRYREFTAYTSENDVRQSILKETEKILSDTGGNGLVANLDEFKSALAKYAADSSYNKELASVVRNEAYSICQTLHSYASDLENLRQENIIELNNSISEVNDIVDRIVEYNKAITGEYNITAADKIYKKESVIGSYGPNELIDARNELIDQLSFYANIKVYDNDDGSVKIIMGTGDELSPNGVEIVNGNSYEHLVLKNFNSSSVSQTFEDYDAAMVVFTNGVDANKMITTGDIRARLDMINGNGSYASSHQNTEYGIRYYQSTVNEFARAFAEHMNKLNSMFESYGGDGRAMFAASSDYDKNGNRVVVTVTDEDGNPVLDKDGNVVTKLADREIITAWNINISQEWLNDANMIGQVYTPDKSKPDDPDNDIWNGEWKLSLDGNNVNTIYLGVDEEFSVGRAGEFKGSIYDYLLFVDNRLSESISYYGEQYDLNSKNANAILDTRQSISGVSKEEEGVNMMNYQKWFNASSRMLTTLDEMLDRLVNNTGVVGR
ncbi:MAG TPA: flagellar hook-associated protein FlgK [Ruminococcaceae bacterium]|nr:flagellar hook-associated protein FlgK [Oscillospiraceae bacterium]